MNLSGNWRISNEDCFFIRASWLAASLEINDLPSAIQSIQQLIKQTTIWIDLSAINQILVC